MSAPESYQLESLHSEVDAGKPPSPSPSTASIDPSQVRWLENQRSRGCEVCKIVCRGLGTVSCAIIVVICFVWYSYRPYVVLNIWPSICLIAALPSFLWDLAEFLTICARLGRGITPKAHIGVEFILTLLSGAATIWVSLQLSWIDLNVALNPIAVIVGECALMGTNTLVRFWLFIRACVERRREIRRRRPRIMYIPETGQTVYVVAKPFPKQPTWKSQQSGRAPSFPRSQSNENPRQIPQLRVDVPASSPQLFFQPEEETPPPLPDRPAKEETPPPLPDRPSAAAPLAWIKRKPVRGVPPNIPPGDHERYMKPSMRPPPDDYVPDEAELERMRRGDAQPQLILPGDVDLKFATSITGMTPADADSREGKFRMVRHAGTGESSRAGARAMSM
ncbi:hypothetical protein CkaCkLH20_10735 [Colletotrichum karsti]|uniref:Uncharacterized protein n=1 Tax=Colletotrichum karsti TaxID=1095194 RepID=A0A9P6LG44_9PEZI|nr:uncharacterized protein CkaCkLH20_10735 [Colletotrichum karsti]KAF9871801.1 hypothetical protein CkaCkLH20_10735 [Colletotrichum karsti]